MVGDSAQSDSESGSGIEPPVHPRIRKALGLLERFAPAIGARWATELWCTPPVVDASLRMPPGVPPSEPVEAYWSGHRVAGEAWGQGPVVYLVHGWGGCRAHLGVFVKPLVAAGHRVIAFDLPAHNDSDAGVLAAGRTHLVECAEAVSAFIRTHGPARAIVAHSLGAKAAALALTDGAEIERLVFLAPMGDFDFYLDMFAERHGFGPRVRDGLHRRLAQRIEMPLHETDLGFIGANRVPDTAAGHPRPRRPRRALSIQCGIHRLLAGCGVGDHPRVGPVGALPDPAAPRRDQRRRRIHRRCPVIASCSDTLCTWISCGASSR